MSTLVITGITGSLGQAILRQQELLKSHGITKIRGLSRDEQKQVALMRKYRGEIQLGCYLGDVSDRERMHFGLKDADYVIHAAAQKHIDKFELDVKFGYKNNIIGTQNVAEGLLLSKKAKRGVFVSTDKAILPITSYGVSKLAAQHLWFWHNTFQKEVSFAVAIYGNVFASRGSVIETWHRQALERRPLTITDETCTRFFITVEDAAKFVIAALFDEQKKVYIPTMKSTEMITLAKIIWEQHNEDRFQYEVTGFRSVEKTHEILEAEGKSSFEVDRFSKQELIEMYEGALCRFG